LHGPQGGSAALVDSYYEQYEDYEDQFPGEAQARRLFDQTHRTIKQVLPSIRDSRWANKTDFYTLFVVLAGLLRTHTLSATAARRLRRVLDDFALEVDNRLSNQKAKASAAAIKYVRAAEKGANEKARRADRHEALTTLVTPLFRPR
jgi:hypothetical protein